MNFDKWKKLNEAMNFPLGIKAASTFFINQRGDSRVQATEAAPEAEAGLIPEEPLFNQTAAEQNAEELKQFHSSFDEYCPFENQPKIGTKEFEDAFDKSLQTHGYNPGQKHSDGLVAQEDVLLTQAKEDEVMPVVNDPTYDPAKSAPPGWDREWQQFDWQEDWNKEPKKS